MQEKRDVTKIQQFWKERALKYGESPESSWGDLLMQKEVSVLLKYLNDGDYVLDVGCANGYSSVNLIKERKIKLVGIDYVDEMIKRANKIKRRLPKKLRKRIEFKKGNALDLQFPEETFNKVNMTRCLCNLTKWKDQREAIRQAWRVLKPGGMLLISEPTIQGLRKLNKIGKLLGLKSLSAPWHNLYIDEKKLLSLSKKLTKSNSGLKIDNFSSTYYLLSRIIYRWIMRDNTERLKRESIFNKIGLLLPAFGDWGVQRLYAIKKPFT